MQSQRAVLAMSFVIDEQVLRKVASADCVRRLSSPNDGELVAATYALERILKSVGRDVHALATVENPNGKGVPDEQMQKVWDAAYARGVQDAENRQHGIDDFSAPTASRPGKRSRSSSSATSIDSIRSTTNSSTTWRRAPRGGTSQQSASTNICTACSSSSGEKSRERAGRRGTVRQFLGLIRAMPRKRSQWRRRPACCSYPHQPRRREHLGEPLRTLAMSTPWRQTAIAAAAAGHNVYIEGRTVRKELRGNKRGGLEDTACGCSASLPIATPIRTRPATSPSSQRS